MARFPSEALGVLAAQTFSDATAHAATAAHHSFPPNHPTFPSSPGSFVGRADILADFAGHLSCPYASEWIIKGPERAARDLSARRRRRAAEVVAEEVIGSCSYTNPWTNQPSCVEMRGAKAWTLESMMARCNEDGTKGVLTEGKGCALPTTLAGWCVVTNSAYGGGTEASPLDGSMGCDPVSSACETFVGGTFLAAQACGGSGDGAADDGSGVSGKDGFAKGGGSSVSSSTGNDGGVKVEKCSIAPGAIGAAHQSGFSGGYHTNCPGTPAEGSPYMWPIKWAANTESRYMEYGSDEVKYRSKGRVYYQLDKNWKRQDLYFQEGVLRSIGQMPCEEDKKVEDVGGAPNACDRSQERLRTMLHRGGKMFFIYWKNGTMPDALDDVGNIERCSWVDLKVIGNVRPDWFMDDRGDDTDVQYLGNQHVFHSDMEARLVKQWRKKDFANHYFTMSMGGNPKPEEGEIHWPLILNIPGEGFGDDAIRLYKNHTLLTEEDDDLFLLDEIYEAAGGSCPLQAIEGASGGPPILDEPIPSNLEVDPNSWFSSVYTYSPVWEPPSREGASSVAVVNDGTKLAVTNAGPSTTVASCYDAGTDTVRMTVTFTDVALDDGTIPWLGLAFRDSDECLMTPRGGGDGEFIYVHRPDDAEGDDLFMMHGPLPASTKGFGNTATDDVVAGLVPIEEAEGFETAGANAKILEDGSSVEFTFHRAVSSLGALVSGSSSVSRSNILNVPPDVIYLTYAVGMTSELGYHDTRQCFEVTEFPQCARSGSTKLDAEPSDSEKVTETVPTVAKSTSSSSYLFPSLTLAIFNVVALFASLSV